MFLPAEEMQKSTIKYKNLIINVSNINISKTKITVQQFDDNFHPLSTRHFPAVKFQR